MKKIVLIVLAFIAILSFSACEKSPIIKDYEQQIEDYEEQIYDYEYQIEDLETGLRWAEEDSEDYYSALENIRNICEAVSDEWYLSGMNYDKLSENEKYLYGSIKHILKESARYASDDYYESCLEILPNEQWEDELTAKESD